MPDPQAETTFASARLNWSWPEGSRRAGLRHLYQDLLAARRTGRPCATSAAARAFCSGEVGKPAVLPAAWRPCA